MNPSRPPRKGGDKVKGEDTVTKEQKIVTKEGKGRVWGLKDTVTE